MKSKYYDYECKQCGECNVSFMADVHWDPRDQRYIFEEICFGSKPYCHTCKEHTEVEQVWYPAPDPFIEQFAAARRAKLKATKIH